jgi:NAD(P)-dependent dehydrogenase (short-subunit alcohol dehydrogenase family)
VSTATGEPGLVREPLLAGRVVLCIGGSAGIGLATARAARAEGADVVLTGRNPERLRLAAAELDPVGTATFDATDPDALQAFFEQLDSPIDHVMVTAGGPYYGPLAEMDFAEARRAVDEHLWLMLEVGRRAIGRVRDGGTLLFMTGAGRHQPGVGRTVSSAIAAAQPAVAANLALELAPMRVNLIAAGFVDTPLSASLLREQLDPRRQHLRETLPVRRVVEAAHVAALAVHIMGNPVITGVTYDIDGGEQLLRG